MSSKKGKRLVKYAGWNVKAQGATKKAPIRRSVRRARQFAKLARVRPEVFMAVEVDDALGFSKLLKRKPLGLRRAPNGGHWRFVWYNPKVVDLIVSGLHTLPARQKGDPKRVAWMVGRVRGRKSIFVSAHLDNDSTHAVKLAQAQDVIDLIRWLRDKHEIAEKDVYLYCDTNDPTGRVNALFDRSGLTTARKAKTRYGAAWRSNNKWLSRSGRAVKGLSIDYLGAGDGRPHRKFWSHGSSSSTDHDLQVAEAVFI